MNDIPFPRTTNLFADDTSSYIIDSVPSSLESKLQERTDLSELQNGSDHAVVASYSGLYEECDVEHINVFGLVFYTRQLVLCSEF